MRASHDFASVRASLRRSRNAGVMNGTAPQKLREGMRRLSKRGSSGEASPGDEAGAVLILALVFLVAVSLIVVGLLTWVGTSLSATTTFGQSRSLEEAATSAVNLAIQNSRYTFASQMTNASPPSACWYSNSVAQQPPVLENYSIDVWCSMVWQPSSSDTRTITYSACPTGGTGSPTQTTDPATCASAPLLQVVITYDDYAPGLIVPSPSPVPCNKTGLCGQTITQDSWQWTPVVPSVTSISPTSSSINGGATITITGNGFVTGSTVNFVEESGNVPASDNTIITIPASQVTWGGCSGNNGTNCTLSVTSPSVTEGTGYFVTVTTPSGTSAYVPTPGSTSYTVLQYQYSGVIPTVTQISGSNETNGVPGGSITGGSIITVTGTGFFSSSNFAAQVWFVQGANQVEANNIDVVSNTTITASSPVVSATGNWYVQVQTLAGSSTNTTDYFAYSVQVPIIVGLSPSSGGPSTQISITGDNFLSGSGTCTTGNASTQTCVAFYLDTAGAPTGNPIYVPFTVNSPTSITVSIASNGSGLTANNSYFPEVSLASSYGVPASQPYNEPSDTFNYT